MAKNAKIQAQPKKQVQPQKQMTRVEWAAAQYESGKMKVKEIAEALKISERTVRGYIWRVRHPEQYREIVKRYFANKRGEAPAEAPAEKPKKQRSQFQQAEAQKARMQKAAPEINLEKMSKAQLIAILKKVA